MKYRLKDRRLASTALIALVAVLALTNLVDWVADLGMQRVNNKCDAYLVDWRNQALATAATAGIMNAGLSVIEDSELQLEPGGMGASVALGDFVRPVNDMASRILYVTLAAAVSLEIQQKLIELGALVGLRWFLAASMLFLGLAVWFDASLLRRLAWGLFVLALVVRFLVPAAVSITGTIGDHLAQDAYDQTQAQFAQLQSVATKTKSKVINAVPTAKDVWDTVNPFIKDQDKPSTPDELKLQLQRLINSLAKMRDAIGHLAVTLLAVFILQTILMPVLTLWALVKLPGYLLGPSGMEELGKWFLALLRGGKKPISWPRRVPEVEAHPQP